MALLMASHRRPNHFAEQAETDRIVALPHGRVPPHNLDAERSLLGGILLDSQAFNDVVEIVRAEEFYRDAHRKVFEAMTSLASSSQPIDRITVKNALVEQGAFESVGGDEFIDLLDKIVPTAANLAYYAKIVHDKALARRLIEAATGIAQLGYEQHGEVGEFAAEAQRKLDGAIGGARSGISETAWRDLTPEEAGTDPEPQQFILSPYIPTGLVSVLSGPGGSAKTTLTVYVAICRALGLRFFDSVPMAEGHTVVVSTEDDIEAYRRKLSAWRGELGDVYDARRVAQRIHFVDLSGESIRLIGSNFGQYQQTGAVDDLARTINRRCPEASLIIAETLSRFTGGAEGNEANSIVIEAGQRICKLTGAAVWFIGHVSQDAGRRGVADQYAGRGGSSLGDNGRSSMVLTRLTADNAKKYAPTMASLSEEEMDKLLLFTHPKANGPTAQPLVLERVVTPLALVLRPYEAVAREQESEWDRIKKLRGVVERLTGKGLQVSSRMLRDYTGEIGVSKDGLYRLITEATMAHAIKEEPREGRGGGRRLVAVPMPVTASDWRSDT